jgi:hypothetical protein
MTNTLELSRTRSHIDDCFEVFRVKLEECTIKPQPRPHWIPRNFILRSDLRDWLSSPDKSGDSPTAILLDAVYKDWTQGDVPIRTGAVIERCLFTFCILLELKLGDLIHTFDRAGILDSQLPRKLVDLEPDIATALKHHGLLPAEAKTQAKDLANRFDQKQWKYFAVRFQDGRRFQESNRRRRFPFIDRRLITDKGGFADVFEVAIPGSFLDTALKKKSPQPLVHPQFPQLGPVSHLIHFATVVDKYDDN